MAGTQAQSKTTRAKASRKKAGARITHALLTGYPGFIGKRLAVRLLEERKGARLTLLVQEKFKADAERYLSKMPESQSKRVELLVGDVAQIDLGLSGPEIEALTTSVTHVFHLAAVQYLGVGEEETERVNVGGTRNVLALARELQNLKRLVKQVAIPPPRPIIA